VDEQGSDIPRYMGTCIACGDAFDKRRIDEHTGQVLGINRSLKTCPRHRWARRKTRVDRTTAYLRDEAAQRFVHDNPDGATLEEVAAALGVSRERVRQIEARAIRKLRGVVSPEQLAELLGLVPRHDDDDAESTHQEERAGDDAGAGDDVDRGLVDGDATLAPA